MLTISLRFFDVRAKTYKSLFLTLLSYSFSLSDSSFSILLLLIFLLPHLPLFLLILRFIVFLRLHLLQSSLVSQFSPLPIISTLFLSLSSNFYCLFLYLNMIPNSLAPGGIRFLSGVSGLFIILSVSLWRFYGFLPSTPFFLSDISRTFY